MKVIVNTIRGSHSGGSQLYGNVSRRLSNRWTTFEFSCFAQIFVLLALLPRAPLLVIVAHCKPDIPRLAHLHIGAYITKTISSKGSHQVAGDTHHSLGLRISYQTDKLCREISPGLQVIGRSAGTEQAGQTWW